MHYVAIIGTAGRGSDVSLLTRQLFFRMVDKVDEIITVELGLRRPEVVLVSGGAAWGDHVAVGLFLRTRGKEDAYAGLDLHFPAIFTDTRFVGNRDAGTANYYHRLFSEKVGGDSIGGLWRAINAGANVFRGNGFFARNLQVAAKADYVIAQTFNPGDFPKDGGTKHTWDRCLMAKRKIHINLFELSRGL